VGKIEVGEMAGREIESIFLNRLAIG